MKLANIPHIIRGEINHDTGGKYVISVQYKDHVLNVNILEPIVSAISTYFVFPWIEFIKRHGTDNYGTRTITAFLEWLSMSDTMNDIFNFIVEPQINHLRDVAIQQWKQNNRVAAKALCGLATVLDMRRIKVGDTKINGRQLCGLIEHNPSIQKKRFRKRLDGENDGVYVQQFVNTMKDTLEIHIADFVRAGKPLPTSSHQYPLSKRFNPPPPA